MSRSADPTKILAIDTSSQAGSVALCQGTSLVAESFLNVRRTHSETLLPQLEGLLEEAGWALAEIDLFAAVTGPGSFTGLRIGVATVKALAQAVAKPVVGVSSLAMMAMNLPLSPLPVCVFMDARKKEVYTQLFECSESGPRPLDEARVLPPDEVLRQLPGNVALVGDGVPLYRSLIKEALGENCQLPVDTAHQPRAAQAAWLALQLADAGEAIAAAELLPTYIRPSDAELSQQRK